jgi:hypothetical protein
MGVCYDHLSYVDRLAISEGLRHTEQRTGIDLFQPLFLDNVVDRNREPRLGLAFGGVGQTEIVKDVAPAAGDGVVSHQI